MKNRTENISVRYRPQHLTTSRYFLNWCRGPESNRYGYHYPRDFKSRASASSATPAIPLERVMRIELTWLAWKARALPLSYTRILWSWREDLNPQPADYKSAALPIELHQQ